MMPLNRMANAIRASAVCGSLKTAISSTMPSVTSGLDAERRNSSSTSAMKMMEARPVKKTANQIRNWRPI